MSDAPAPDTITVPLASLRPYWRNPRDNDEAVEAVRQSIERYGYTQPIVVDADHEIIAGHTRYKALQALGYENVGVIVVDLPPDKAREYRIADNKSGEIADWRYDDLIAELRTIDDLPSMEAFFPELDLNDLIGDDEAPDGGPTQAGIDDREQEMQGRFADKNADEMAGYAEVTCPECGSDFYVQRDDVLSRMASGGWERIEVALPEGVPDVFEEAADRIRKRLAKDGHELHADPAVSRGQVLEALAAEYLAGPD